MKKRVSKYVSKFKGQGAVAPPREKKTHIFYSWVGSAAGIMAVSAIAFKYSVPMVIGSFGASAVLIYAATDSPLSQPRNLIGGHVVSAIVAVLIFQTMGKSDFTLALAVSFAIVAMLATKTLHPPGGATALIAVDSQQGFMFVLMPVLAGVLIMLLIALVVNNLSGERAYPKYWF
ncbi:hypothetical protein MNBD_NITROSPINAE03-868 [hydrothermal vent metagenome]|uniref:HPP transmembrane region domain-containing protein n=1 Tax=hydrothermal vent metagenome TaxID=652676 RepID=A0A3B1C8D2_9ZZZZ